MRKNSSFEVSRLGSKARAWSVALATGLSAVSAMGQPNIEVRIDSLIQAPNQEFVFGATDIGESTPLIVVIRNIGSANLEFSSSAPIFFSGGFAEQFALIQPPLEAGNLLSPNGSTAFRVDFEPTIAKRFLPTTLSIPSNDPDAPVFSLQLRGVVPVPEMVIRQDGQLIAPQSQVNFPATPIGQSSEVDVTVSNEGERPLELTDAVEAFGGFGSAAFSVVQPAVSTLPAGQSTTFTVVFAPTQTGSLSANVGINSNDIGNFSAGRFTFVVRGVGQPAADEADEPSDEPAIEEGGDENGGGDANGDALDEGGQDAGEVADEVDPADGDAADQADDHGNTADSQPEADNDAANDAATEEAEAVMNELLRPVGACGFGAPLSQAGCLVSLAAARAAGRRRSQ